MVDALRRRLTAVVGVAAGTIAVVSCEMARGAFTGPRDLVVEHPMEAVTAARAMIDEQQRDPTRYGRSVRPAELPVPLRLGGLRYAHVHRDHVDLVLARNPDWEVGGRIWAVDHRRHNDTVTKYSQIHFYRYTNDAPESPDNLP